MLTMIVCLFCIEGPFSLFDTSSSIKQNIGYEHDSSDRKRLRQWLYSIISIKRPCLCVRDYLRGALSLMAISFVSAGTGAGGSYAKSSRAKMDRRQTRKKVHFR